MDYNVLWFLIIGFLLVGYAILDGFDLGVGALHLFARGDHNRRLLLNSIGPVWDGNEVWLVTAGGALFAAFPHVYATAFSSFYLPFMLLLVALIFRAVSIEFRSKEPGAAWRNAWDRGFSIGSIVAALLFGIAIGNVILGFPIGADKEFKGTFFDLISGYSLLTGLFNLVMFTMHGAIYLTLKTEGKLREQVRGWAWRAYFLFVSLYAILTAITLYLRPEMLANFSFGYIEPTGTIHPLIKEYQVLISLIAWIVVALNFLAILNISRTLSRHKYMQAFISSALMMASIILFFALGLFPNMMVSNIDTLYNLDIYNSASSAYTLRVMFILALIGLPFVIGYTSIIYWTYRGVTRLTDSSY
ncbi:cytochrome d ubiquinol oxidase subunit II [Roseivirga sp. BDSF3-8]|uniref:cytochrome d ubiquinol oxidase subunit II n=1 Tax=Roseivirga sp. BDSF3-8 TaxID=3241598 RepID=UPI00353189A6